MCGSWWREGLPPAGRGRGPVSGTRQWFIPRGLEPPPGAPRHPGPSAEEGLSPAGAALPVAHVVVCLSLCREVGAEELGRFCARVSALLQAEDWGPDTLDALRRLFLIVAATKYSRR